MNHLLRHRFPVLLAAALLATPAARAVSLSQVPLFISTGTTPNVMLLIDNSGSMYTIVRAPEFDPALTYPDWAPLIDHDCRSSTPLQKAWAPTDSNIGRSFLVSSAERGVCGSSTGSTCSSDRTRGRNSFGTTKCVILPDPAGGNLTRYDGNYLNYLFDTFANGTDLRDGQIPNSYRMQVARDVATQIVTNNTNLRLGLASFNAPRSGDAGPGGKIDAACGTATSTLVSTIAGLSPEANTPLAESLYEVTRYFRGMSSTYNVGVDYTSPIQYRCQKSFVIVITDGFPTWDTELPSDDPADLADSGRSLPDWDGLAPATSASEYPLFPAHSDGFQPQGGAADEGHTLYLDDLAKFAHEIDLRPSGTDDYGVSFNDPDFPQQNLTTYTVGFAIRNQMLADAAGDGNGLYFTADNEEQLNAALQAAFADIISRLSSASAVAANSTRLTSETAIYQARFSSADWSGQFLAYDIEANGTVGEEAWEASSLIPAPAGRNVLTYDPTRPLGGRGQPFQWANLNASQQAALNTNHIGAFDGLGAQRLGYLRGDRSNEAPSGLQFRARATVLGDIVNSDPLHVGQEDYGFENSAGAEGSSYASFRKSAAYRNRPATVYVGANDGMLHAFDADTGAERFAYVPNAVFSNLSALTAPEFSANHRFILDGSPRALDAYLNGAWRTILLGSLGAGGRGIFALDVTDPAGFDAGDVMWEFTSSNDSDFGFALPQPTIARLYNGKWAAIAGNGYNSGSGRAVLFIIDLETGSLIREIDTEAGGDNGLSSPLPVDVDGDRITDFIYAGDLHGNLWKFDLTASNPGAWNVAFGDGSTPQPLFTACTADPCTGGNRQPITARPEVGIDPQGGYLVYFGTGRYFAVGDNATGGTANTFYAIRDPNDKATTNPLPVDGGRAALLEQEVIGEQVLTFDGVAQPVRVTTDHRIQSSHKGWYLDLPDSGERQVSTPRLRAGRVLFTTLIPANDPCGYGGTSWLVEVDALSGSRLSYSPFDLNGDYEFNEDDFAEIVVDGETVLVPVSARQSTEGIIKTPGIVGADDIEFKYASGSSGGIDTTVENSGDQRGRQSWRQIQ